MSTIKMIPSVEAVDMSTEVLDYCEENDIPTHCDNSIIQITDDGNILSEWLKENGLDFKDKRWTSIGIFGT